MRKKEIRTVAACMAAATLGMTFTFSSGLQDAYALEAEAASEETSEEAFEMMRQKWRNSLLGGEKLKELAEQNNLAVTVYIQNVENTAKQWLDTLIGDRTNGDTIEGKETLWPDLNMKYLAGSGQEARMRTSGIYNHYLRLKSIAIAWATPGCKYYQDPDIEQKILNALKYLNENHYNADKEKFPEFGNWWSWDIGAPVALLDTMVIMGDKIPEEDQKAYIAAANRFTPDCGNYTGANLIDKGMVVAQVGMLTNNEAKLNHVKEQYKKVFQYVTKGDGFHKDGSFIQHSKIAYIGAYGTDLYEKLGILFYIFNDTPWEFIYEDGSEQLVFDMVFKAVEPFLYDGLCMDMVRGRGITRRLDSDKSQGVKLLGTIIPLQDAFPTQEEKERFESMVKYLVGVDEDYFYQTCKYPLSIMTAYEIMEDSSIEPRSNYTIHQLSSGMDRLVHVTPEFGVGIAMHSARTAGHEIINDEGRRTWNVSDGMTYFYNKDRGQYGNGYWATVDPRRLPGTTTEFVMRKNGAGNNKSGAYDWAGGSNLGIYGVAGAHMKTLGNDGERDGTDVKKSWFIFDDEIVAIGSGITSETGNNVETVVDNRRLKTDGSNTVTVKSGWEETIISASEARKTGDTEVTEGTKFKNPSWIHLEGNVDGADMGYYFPEESDVMVLKQQLTGHWKDQNGMAKDEWEDETNYFSTIWFEHGQKPTDASYEYVVLPNQTKECLVAYAQTPDIEILENSERAHAVKETELGITAVNFWSGTNQPVAGIQSDKPASVMMKEEGDRMEIGVSDPTRKQSEPIEVVIYKKGVECIEADENVTVLQTSPFIRLSVDTEGMLGQTSHIVLKTEPGDDYEMTEGQILAVSDAYVEGGGNQEKTGEELFGEELKIKNDGTDSAYCRRAALKFDLTRLPKTWDSLNLALQVRSYNKDFSRAEIYQIENDWDASTITYMDFPKCISDEPAAYLSREELESGGVVMLDVSDVVKEALGKEMTELSLEITIEKTANDNYLGIYSTRAGEGVTKPSLMWSSIEKPQKADKGNLQFVLELAESLNLSDYSNGDLSKLQEAIALGREAVNTENASTEQIHKAEKELTKELTKLRLKQE